MASVVGPAIKHAGIEACDIDGIFVGIMSNGFSKQDFQAALVAMSNERLAYSARGHNTQGWSIACQPIRWIEGQGASDRCNRCSVHIMAAMPLADDAGDMRIPNTKLAGVFNKGGTAVANYVSIMERVK